MAVRIGMLAGFMGALLILFGPSVPAPACCPAGRFLEPVVNADQSVVILWDAATKTQHFIRRASFKSEGDDFGFLIPSPSQPELNESGNEAFPYLARLTAPDFKNEGGGGLSCGCSSKATMVAGKADVRVLEEKVVAGFNAAVLETKSADALVGWLKDHGYAYSPEIQAWAKPYVEGGWIITALKVARDKDAVEQKSVTASALRMSFKTDRPLFPYREPDSKTSAETLGAKQRMLRIYFLAEGRYDGALTREVPWTGKTAWANKLSAADRKQVLDLLKLPETTGPAEFWLTEFEDAWPYRVAPADVYFHKAADQSTLKRPTVIVYGAGPWPTDVMAFALAAVVVVPPLLRRLGRKG